MATDVRERTVADSQFGSGTPATWYLALSTTTPNEDGSNFSEPSGGAYTRLTITNNTTNFPAAATTGGTTVKSNGVAFTYPNPTASWGVITYWGVFLTSSGGVPEYASVLDQPITVGSGNTPVQFPIGGWYATFE